MHGAVQGAPALPWEVWGWESAGQAATKLLVCKFSRVWRFFLFCFCILQSGKGVGVSGIAGTCACYSAPAPLMLGGSGGGEGALGAQEGL